MGPRPRTSTRASTSARGPRRRIAPTADPIVLLAFAVGLAAGLAIALQSDVVTHLGAVLDAAAGAR